MKNNQNNKQNQKNKQGGAKNCGKGCCSEKENHGRSNGNNDNE